MKTEDNNNIFINKGLFRTPLLPLCSIEELNSKILREFAERPLIQEAIFLSSITFHKEIRKWLNGNQKDPKKISQIELSLYKYITRISSRSTPFGLFASTGFVDIGCNSKLSNVLIGEDVKIFTRLDPSALQKIINYFNQNEELKNILKYTINNSIYSFGNNDIRYFEKTINKNEISFELSSVDYNYYLNEIIKFCNTPRSFREIISNCFEYNLNTNDVVAFFNQLLDEKLLLSELEIILTTYNPLQKFIDLLNDRIKSSNPSKELTQKIKKIERINQILNGNSSVINKHNEISSILKVYNININPNDIIHSDSKRDIISPITLNPNLIDAKNILLKLTPPKKDSFEQFKKNFRRRYENRTMPLLQILDPESGIGYRQTGETGDDLFLLKKIKFDFVNNVEFTLSQIDEFLLKKIIKLKESNSKEINLNLEELSIFSSKKNSDLDTGCVIFSIIDKDNSILLDGFNGPSTLNIINRFSYLDERTINLAEYLVNEEQKINTTSFLAEITHLPDFKTGNLLFYKPFRDFEIPCVTESDLINEHKILLSDLSIRMVSHLNNSRIQLISSKLNKPVLPRLSNSVNYNRKSMDVFKFLSDLQYQDSPRSLKFNWGSVAKFFDYFPRVNYKNIILSPAQWIVSSNELEFLKDKSLSDLEVNTKLLKWIEEREIPKKVFFKTAFNDDNKLFIDFSVKFGLEVFKKEVKKYSSIILSETCISKESPIKDSKGFSYNNEVVVPFIDYNLAKIKNSDNLQFLNNVSVKNENQRQRKFLPSSEWVYFKIYVGHKIADSLLKNEISNLVNELYEKDIISKWFFIRYSDEDFHLRLRFLLTSNVLFSDLVKSLNNTLKVYIETEVIHNIKIESYVREIERYSPKYINDCESIFAFDSSSICQYLQLNKTKRWLFAILGIDYYLDNFGLEIHEKAEIMKILSDSFFKEFGGGKVLRDTLNKKYGENRRYINAFLDYELEHEDRKDLLTIIERRSVNILSLFRIKKDNKILIKNNEILNLLPSIIHMFLNRLFESNHRRQELVLYYFLSKHYNSLKVRSLKQKSL